MRVRNVHPPGHTRCPRYVRGKRGVIVRVDGEYPLPDFAAHAVAPARPLRVRFAASELWGATAGARRPVVDLWERYLEPA